MKLEQGKFYRTRNGSVVGLLHSARFEDFPWKDDKGNWWTNSGYHNYEAHDSNNPDLDIVAEWSKSPRTWSKMTNAEKVALLLAHHEGKVIEYFSKIRNQWESNEYPSWDDSTAYRISNREVLTCMLVHDTFTHSVTIESLNGVLDWDSIKAT